MLWLSLIPPSISKHSLSFSLCQISLTHPVFLTLLLSLPVFTVLPSLFFPFVLFSHFLSSLSFCNFDCSPSTSLHPSPLSISHHHPPPPSLSMDNSSVFLRAAVCLPAYCDFHWDSFRDHSHLSRELEPRLWREINHSHLILTRIHKHIHEITRTHRRMFFLILSFFRHSYSLAFCFNSQLLL